MRGGRAVAESEWREHTFACRRRPHKYTDDDSGRIHASDGLTGGGTPPYIIA